MIESTVRPTECCSNRLDLVVSNRSNDLGWRLEGDCLFPNLAIENQYPLPHKRGMNEPSSDRKTKRENSRFALSLSVNFLPRDVLFALRHKFARLIHASEPRRDKVDTVYDYCVEYSGDFAQGRLGRSCAILEEEMQRFCPNLNAMLACRIAEETKFRSFTSLSTCH